MHGRINCRQRFQAGFTLIELVAVIVLLGIISVGVSGYIRSSVEAYKEVTRRDTITQLGRFAVERISREVKAALPGSVRIGSSGGAECLEFVPALASSVYVDAPFPPDGSATFEVVDFAQASDPAISRVAIYTLSNTDVYTQPSGGSFVAELNASNGISTVVTNGLRTITLDTANTFPQPSSVAKRIYFIDEPVSFCLSGGSLTRYSGYGYTSSQNEPPSGGQSSLLAERLNIAGGQAFTYQQTVQIPNGMVGLDFTFTAVNTTDETVRFVHDIALVNAQ